MPNTPWPDLLQPPQRDQIQDWLDSFWLELAVLGDLLPRDQTLLAAEQLHKVRGIVLQMMLALNGIQRPPTRDLNIYLSASQRAAIEKTLAMPRLEHSSWADIWIGQAVSLVVIYRWYAPQLIAKYHLRYPSEQERESTRTLLENLPEWPEQIATE